MSMMSKRRAARSGTQKCPICTMVQDLVNAENVEIEN
jgi:hypothetical protein